MPFAFAMRAGRGAAAAPAPAAGRASIGAVLARIHPTCCPRPSVPSPACNPAPLTMCCLPRPYRLNATGAPEPASARASTPGSLAHPTARVSQSEHAHAQRPPFDPRTVAPRILFGCSAAAPRPPRPICVAHNIPAFSKTEMGQIHARVPMQWPARARTRVDESLSAAGEDAEAQCSAAPRPAPTARHRRRPRRVRQRTHHPDVHGPARLPTPPTSLHACCVKHECMKQHVPSDGCHRHARAPPAPAHAPAESGSTRKTACPLPLPHPRDPSARTQRDVARGCGYGVWALISACVRHVCVHEARGADPRRLFGAGQRNATQSRAAQSENGGRNGSGEVKVPGWTCEELARARSVLADPAIERSNRIEPDSTFARAFLSRIWIRSRQTIAHSADKGERACPGILRYRKPPLPTNPGRSLESKQAWEKAMRSAAEISSSLQEPRKNALPLLHTLATISRSLLTHPSATSVPLFGVPPATELLFGRLSLGAPALAYGSVRVGHRAQTAPHPAAPHRPVFTPTPRSQLAARPSARRAPSDQHAHAHEPDPEVQRAGDMAMTTPRSSVVSSCAESRGSPARASTAGA
ncbi:hypothetical protein HETIRDRAFT_108117 [Heterobasidion irregulare TC 32-1]|uniref:Uncharacterized protein n=1 Tax=Heterobasidion irregulare (strain TC 32-1) TaxID=747525 RepID=W4JQE3_HETIT|nr:uncharacterized protein HETIRDRAFT_108117 [Heterobasidion irregulare TC 32-1]ETW75290.1 hypothetical protein HETIRDRAFT_108117 [Heterobasidion irregulare TC 32-1]